MMVIRMTTLLDQPCSLEQQRTLDSMGVISLPHIFFKCEKSVLFLKKRFYR